MKDYGEERYLSDSGIEQKVARSARKFQVPEHAATKRGGVVGARIRNSRH